MRHHAKWRRLCSVLLAACMLLGMLAIPQKVVAQEETSDIGGGTSSVVSSPVYEHAMDKMSSSLYLPTGWSRTGQYVKGSSIITSEDGTRTYYQMKRSGEEGSATSYGYYTNKVDGVTTAYSSAALKYSVMVDNTSTGWTVHLPSFAKATNGRAITLLIKNADGKNTLQAGSDTMELVSGSWYDIELLLVNGSAWSLYVGGELLGSGTVSGSFKYLNMAIANAGGDSNLGTAGAGVSMNIDDLAVYDYVKGTDFAFAKESYEVVKDSTIQPVWNMAPANAYCHTVTYTSADASIATIASDGTVTGIEVGETTITATPAATSGLSPATVKVTVIGEAKPVTGVSIKEKDVEVNVEDTVTLTASVSPGDATNQNVTWSSSDTSIATVDAATGVVTGVKEGEADITVTTQDGGYTATVTVAVKDIKAETIVINEGAETVEAMVNDTISLTAAITPENATTREVTWTSSDGSTAAVDTNGVVTCLQAGEAVITATVAGVTPAVSDTITVKITEATQVYTYQEDFEEGKLNGWTIKISCGNTEYASIAVADRPYGDNTANKALVLSHTAQAGNSMRAVRQFSSGTTLTRAVIEYDFLIDEEVGSVYLPGFSNGNTGMVGQLMVGYGRLSRMTADSWKGVGMSIEADTWYHLEQVVDVDAGVYDLYINDALVLAQEPIADNKVAFDRVYAGMYKITSNNQFIDNIVVTGTIDAVTDVSFVNPPKEVVIGAEATQLELAITPNKNAFRSATFISSDETIATVDSLGRITGHQAGTVTITAIPNGNTALKVETEITVLEKPITAIEAEDISLHVGGHVYLQPTITPADAGYDEMTYASDNEDVATVDEWGEVIAKSAGTAHITLTSVSYPKMTKTITVTVEEMQISQTLYVSVDGSGDGTSKEAPMSLQAAMEKVTTLDKTQGSIVVELAEGYYKQTQGLHFTAAHGGTNDHYVIWRAAEGAQVTIGGAEVLDAEITEGFTKVEGTDYYVAQLNTDIATRHLFVDNVRATRARSKGGLTDPALLKSEDGLIYTGFSSADMELLDIPEDDRGDLEFSYSVEWSNHWGGSADIVDAGDGRVNIIMDQPSFQALVSHSNVSVKELVDPSRPYSMFYENALMLLDEPGEWYFDNEERKLYYMPRPWEDINDITITYPIIDDWVQDGKEDTDAGLINVIGDENGIVQNIKFEGICFADTTYSRTSTELGFSATQGQHIRDYNSTSADTQPDAAITLKRTNSIHFTDCSFTRLGITGIGMKEGTQNTQIVGSHFYDISGNAMYIGLTKFYISEIYNPSDPLMIVKNCDTYNNYIHDVGVEYDSASAIAVGYAAYVNSEHNEIFAVDYSPYHIGYGWTAEIENVLKHTTIANNFIHDYNQAGVWDSGGIYVLGTSGGALDVTTGIGNNLISGNYLRNMGVGTAALYNDGGSDNWIWEYNVVDLSESPLWYNAYTPNGAQWLLISSGNSPCILRHNYTSVSKTFANFKRASGNSFKIQQPYNETDLNDNNYGLVFQENVVCEDLNWPQEALDIMAAAGLEAEYESLRNGHAERIVSELPEEGIVSLAEGDTFTIGLKATDGKDTPVTLAEGSVYYEVTDDSIASVSADGVITAKAEGDTLVRIYVLTNHIVQTLECSVAVGNDLEDITINGVGEDNVISMPIDHDGLILKPYAVTERGVSLTPDTIAYEVVDTKIATVEEGGLVKPAAIGETTLKITVTVGEKSFTKDFELQVTEPISFVLDDLEEIFKADSSSNWVRSKTTITLTEETEVSLKGSSGTGYATFAGNTYLNELFCFQFGLTKVGGWPSIVLRAQDTNGYVAGGTSGYLISFIKSGGKCYVQLQRFNGGDRTVLYGTVEGFDAVYGGDILYEVTDLAELKKVQVGALTSGSSVRLYMSIDGKVIFDCLDEGEGALVNEGYFGIVGKQNDVFRFVKDDLAGYALPDANNQIDVQVNIMGEDTAGITVTEPKAGWTEGTNTFTVSGNDACVVAVSHDGGETYERLEGVLESEGVYSYTAEKMTADAMIAVTTTGDVTGDGKVTNADITRLRAAYAGKVTLKGLSALTADVNEDGKVTNADITRLRAAYAGKIS